MNLLLKTFTDSFLIFSRNFVLVYPLLFFLLLFPLLTPDNGELPNLELKWILWATIIGLLYFAFIAGWYNMIRVAVAQYLGVDEKRAAAASSSGGRSDETPVSLFPMSFSIFREFFPGVGQYFPSFALGGALQVSAILLVVFGAQLAVDYWVPSTAVVERLFAWDPTGPDPYVSAVQFINKLTIGERIQLENFFMIVTGAVAAYGMFLLLTMFWAPIILIRRVGTFRAYGLSILQFLRDPLRVMAVGLFPLLVIFSASFMSQGLLILLQSAAYQEVMVVFLFLMQMFSLLFNVYYPVLVFTYAMRAIGPAAPSTDLPTAGGGPLPSGGQPSKSRE